MLTGPATNTPRLIISALQAKEEANDMDQKTEDDYQAEKARMIEDAKKLVLHKSEHFITLEH